jgi:spoIIIJ-associated protein
MDGELRSFEAEGAGDDVAAARADALLALRDLAGTLAADDVEFVIVSEGERGLMGVGRQPARVLARAQVAAVALGPVAERVREVVERIASAIDPELAVTVAERGARVVAVASGGDTARLIGRHGQTIDAVQHLAAAAALPGSDGDWEIVVDTAGYRARRERRLRALALKAAGRAVREGRAQALEPMSSAERRIVHTVLVDHDGVETASEGRDPARFVVVRPRAASDPEQ